MGKAQRYLKWLFIAGACRALCGWLCGCQAYAATEEPHGLGATTLVKAEPVDTSSAAPRPGAHMDHSPRHGGVVMMYGDVHFEVVLDPRGRHALYFSDAVREPMESSLVHDVVLTISRRGAYDETLKAAPGDAAGCFRAAGRWLLGSETVIRIAFDTQPEPYSIDLPLQGGSIVSRGPHGGVTAAAAGGMVELAALPSGMMMLWVLDAAARPRALEGMSARVQVAQEGYAEVVLEESEDHFAGRGAPLLGAHPSVAVLLSQGGQTETVRFTLHLEHPGTARHDLAAH